MNAEKPCGCADIVPCMCAEPEYVVSDDAGLGVGHVWTNVRCAAYRTLNGADYVPCARCGQAKVLRHTGTVCPDCQRTDAYGLSAPGWQDRHGDAYTEAD